MPCIPISHPTFFQSASGNWQKISRWTAMCGLAISAFGASIDALSWEYGGNVGTFGWCATCLDILLFLGVVYFAASDILGRRTTLLGWLRFTLTTVALFAPTMLAFGLLILIKPFLSESWRMSLLLVVLVASFVIITLLPAWPLSQPMKTSLVSPLAVFRATRGHRGGLILISFALGSINKADLIPHMKSANNVGEVFLIGAGQTLMGLVSIALTASIAATAFEFAALNDAEIEV